MRRRALLLTLFSALAAPAGAEGFDEWLFFQTPSGNIHCGLIQDADFTGLRCDIIAMDGPAPARPAECEFDYGQFFELLPNGRPVRICAGDTFVTPDSARLRYGTSISRHGITCRSETTGLECRNAEGHGFALSRAVQRLF